MNPNEVVPDRIQRDRFLQVRQTEFEIATVLICGACHFSDQPQAEMKEQRPKKRIEKQPA